MKVTRLSIVIPVYNEQETVVPVIEKVVAVRLPDGIEKEIIIVNDASTDQSHSRIESFVDGFRSPGTTIKFITHLENKGKGGAIHTAIHSVNGEYMIIQDADLELDPGDYVHLLGPVLNDKADVVYGSRFLNGTEKSGSGLLSVAANKFLTSLSNFSFGTRLTDMETCYKLIPVAAIQALDLKEERFGFEPEITAKLSRNKKLRFKEVPVTYVARTELQGKKIGWSDGIRAVWCIVKYGLLKA
jgi:glycosyltransferase involved in cell wall biosynthesis